MISSVSFASAQAGTTSFEDKIKQPQAFVTKEAPQAATGINDKKKKGGAGKKLGTIVLAVVAAAALLAGIAKKGVLKVNPDGNKTLNTIKTAINSAGDWILKQGKALKDKILPKAQEHVDEFV